MINGGLKVMFKTMLLAGVSLSLVFCSAQSSISEESKTVFPSVELSNGIIKMSVYLPDPEKGYYRGRRFDWSGVISQVEYKGHTYFGEWKNTHEPNNNDDIVGPVEEFRTGSFDVPGALGYNEAKLGEPFIKIGIGLLEKIEEPAYNYGLAYKIIEPGKWKVSFGKDWIEFQQDFPGTNGWSYIYTKKITLSKDKPDFTIAHSLKNTGTKPIETSQYNHNFFIIDNTPIGTDYMLNFPFDVKMRRDLKGAMEAKGGEFYFNRNLVENESLFTEIDGFSNDPKDYDITILNKKTGAGVIIKGDKPLVHVNFWTMKLTVCPEPFVSVDLALNEQKDWSITYSFFVKP
jgi:hypothetical protein